MYEKKKEPFDDDKMIPVFGFGKFFILFFTLF